MSPELFCCASVEDIQPPQYVLRFWTRIITFQPQVSAFCPAPSSQLPISSAPLVCQWSGLTDRLCCFGYWAGQCLSHFPFPWLVWVHSVPDRELWKIRKGIYFPLTAQKHWWASWTHWCLRRVSYPSSLLTLCLFSCHLAQYLNSTGLRAN